MTDIPGSERRKEEIMKYMKEGRKEMKLGQYKGIPVLNQVLNTEDSILSLGDRWRLVISFTPRPFLLRRWAPSTHRAEDWVGIRACLDTRPRET
jgi:hypothetical protein